MIREEFRESYEECLEAVGLRGLEHEGIQRRLRDLRAGFQLLWGKRPPPVHQLVELFISQGSSDALPRDAWFFSDTHCMVARNFVAGSEDELRVYPLSEKFEALRIEKEIEPTPQGRLSVTLTLTGGIELDLYAQGENRERLQEVLRARVMPNLR